MTPAKYVMTPIQARAVAEMSLEKHRNVNNARYATYLVNKESVNDVIVFSKDFESSGTVGRNVSTVQVSAAEAEARKMPAISAGSALPGTRR